MKKLLFIVIFIYFNFTICNGFSQASTSDVNISESNSIRNPLKIDNQIISDNDDLIYSSINFTANGLKNFFNQKFNNPKYAQDYLPHNLSDLIYFLEYAKITNQNKKFIKTVFKIFHQKFKAVEYLNAQEFNKFLAKLTNLIEYSFTKLKYSEHEKIRNILYSEFLNKYQFFKDDPHKFFSNLSEMIYLSVAKKSLDYTTINDDISGDELRVCLLRLIENMSSKLIWFVEDEPDIWSQFKETCNNLYNLKNIIYDIDDINDLIRSALERFILLLNVRGTSLPIEFFERVYNEIIQNPPVWLQLEELDELMLTKINTLLLALKATYTKAFARNQYGIIT